ncbi:hypothetical protein [Xenorhabdus doucetiae]|uniref:hypothetical protein n=1 Tax=Xenorhabdus doucetiae TaxID=351671 RepID=UPI002B416255|nr:hypothetical protein [Xenorhabdus sp. 3]
MRYQAALLAENEAHLTASAAYRQYLFKDKCLFDDKPSKIQATKSLTLKVRLCLKPINQGLLEQ